MKLLLDQNLSFRILAKIKAFYPGSTQTHSAGMDQMDDLVIWHYAKSEGFVIVTKDSDFHEFSLMYGHPPKVIWLKCGNKPRQYLLDLLLINQEKINDFFEDERSSCLEIY